MSIWLIAMIIMTTMFIIDSGNTFWRRDANPKWTQLWKHLDTISRISTLQKIKVSGIEGLLDVKVGVGISYYALVEGYAFMKTIKHWCAGHQSHRTSKPQGSVILMPCIGSADTGCLRQ
jgi:hypothetical protein